MTDSPAFPPKLDFQLLFESLPGLYLVFTPDQKIVAVSNKYLRATRTERETILGRYVFEVFPANPDDPDADWVTSLRDSLNSVLRSGVADGMPAHKINLPVSESGSEERHWSPVNSPVLSAEGEIIYIIHRITMLPSWSASILRVARITMSSHAQARID